MKPKNIVKNIILNIPPCPICGHLYEPYHSHFYDPFYGSCLTIRSESFDNFKKKRQEDIMIKEKENKIEMAWKNGYTSGVKSKNQELIGTLIVGIVIGMVIGMILWIK